jgi:hypothetical protein
MGLIDGEPLNSTEDLAAGGGIAKALSHFTQFRNNQPAHLAEVSHTDFFEWCKSWAREAKPRAARPVRYILFCIQLFDSC